MSLIQYFGKEVDKSVLVSQRIHRADEVAATSFFHPEYFHWRQTRPEAVLNNSAQSLNLLA